MKRINAIMVALICVIHVCAQDRVITKDGDVFDAYRLDIGGTYIYYTKEDNENADVQKIAKADVLMIKKKTVQRLTSRRISQTLHQVNLNDLLVKISRVSYR